MLVYLDIFFKTVGLPFCKGRDGIYSKYEQYPTNIISSQSIVQCHED